MPMTYTTFKQICNENITLVIAKGIPEGTIYTTKGTVPTQNGVLSTMKIPL